MTVMNNRLKLYEHLKRESKNLFANSHNVHTPRLLTEEVVNKITITEDMSVLVLFNIEFVITLIEIFGVDSKQITFYTDHENKTKIAKLFGVNYIEEFDDMKFDVVLGNPPYQDNKDKKSSGTNNLWPLFVEKSVDLLKDQGHLAFITPATWMRKSRDILRKKSLGGSKRLLTDIFQPNNLKYVNIGGAKKYFPNIGSTFTWYILQKSPYSGSTEIDVNDELCNIDIRNVESIPYILNKSAISIFYKVQQGANKWTFSSVETFKTKERKSSKDSEFKYPYLNYKTNNTLQKTDLGVDVVYGNEKHPCADKRKVVVPYVGPTTPYVDDGEYGVLHSQVYFLNNNETCEGAKSVVKSKLYKFLYSEGMSLHNESGVLNVFAKPDLSKVWTDNELYTHFNLTQEEIDYVEANS